MKYPIGTIFHLHYNSNPERPMTGTIVDIDKRLEKYTIKWEYSCSMKDFEATYNDDDVQGICFGDGTYETEYIKVVLPHKVKLPEDLFEI